MKCEFVYDRVRERESETERERERERKEREEGERKTMKNTNLQKVEAIPFPLTVSKLLGCVRARTSILRDSDRTRLRGENKLFAIPKPSNLGSTSSLGSGPGRPFRVGKMSLWLGS